MMNLEILIRIVINSITIVILTSILPCNTPIATTIAIKKYIVLHSIDIVNGNRLLSLFTQDLLYDVEILIKLMYGIK